MDHQGTRGHLGYQGHRGYLNRQGTKDLPGCLGHLVHSAILERLEVIARQGCHCRSFRFRSCLPRTEELEVNWVRGAVIQELTVGCCSLHLGS